MLERPRFQLQKQTRKLYVEISFLRELLFDKSTNLRKNSSSEILNCFYILASSEYVRIPAEYAAEMVPIDPSMGELRVHYAGFFDPGFGDTEDLSKGSKGVLEVRSLDVPFYIEDNQIIARLKYEKLAEPPSKLYGTDIGSTYQSQGLKLSKHFHD